MNTMSLLIRELQLWRHYPGNRTRWRKGENRGPLADHTFMFGGRAFPYYLHPYNNTWANERAVELPVAFDFLRGHPPEDVLEIGNVTSHYIESPHTVIDLYERCFYRRVINKDIMEFRPPRTYPAILAISTFEHVGWNEAPRDPPKLLRAWERLRELLAPGGRALVTVPAGQNDYLDNCLRDQMLPADEIRCLRRVSCINEWEEADLPATLASRYNDPYPNANGVIFMYVNAPA